MTVAVSGCGPGGEGEWRPAPGYEVCSPEMREEIEGSWVIDFTSQPDGPLSPDEWVIETGTEIPGYNDEAQVYTDREKNVRIENGELVIEAHREDYGEGADARRYTSARITTKGIRDMMYGELTVCAKMPYQIAGVWPAIWMLPTHNVHQDGLNQDPAYKDYYLEYKNNGEIDLFESYGGMGDDYAWATVHTLDTHNTRGMSQMADLSEFGGTSEAYHDYGVRWSPERIEFLVDGTVYFVYENPGTDYRDWPFDQPFHALLNVAVGGDWMEHAGGMQIDDEGFPVRMSVQTITYVPAA